MTQEKSIHNVLAHSYLAYFIFSMFGLFADTFIGFSFAVPFAETLALGCFVLGTVLIFWAQATSGRAIRQTDPCANPYFRCGPYRFMRNPTHLGIVLLVMGYTLVSGAILFFLTTTIGYLISNVFFKEYESILYTTYGDQYDEYKKKTPKVF